MYQRRAKVPRNQTHKYACGGTRVQIVEKCTGAGFMQLEVGFLPATNNQPVLHNSFGAIAVSSTRKLDHFPIGKSKSWKFAVSQIASSNRNEMRCYFSVYLAIVHAAVYCC
jgi:hypothetical protein